MLLDVAPPVLERLRWNLGETIHLSVLQGAEVLTVLSKPALRAVTAAEWNGRAVPVHCTSSGRALLFDLDHEAISELLAGVEFRKLGPNTVGGTQELHERVVAACAHGYALVDEEYESGLVAAASPIRDFRDHIVAALNVSAPKFRFGERLEDAGKEVKRAADELSALLGWTTDLDNTGVTDSSEAS
jgi:DNA-binding IclR family transcriptional regulator